MKKIYYTSIVVLCIAISLTTNAQNIYNTYCNARFDYCIEYPSELKGEGESDNGDGEQFALEGTSVRLYVYRDIREAMYETVDECKTECFKEDTKAGEDMTISYQKMGKDFYVVSGTKDGLIFYEKVIYKNSGMITALFVYDKSKKSTYDAYCTHLFNTFK